MTHRFLVLLILLVPLQLSWAAVSAYCEHETAAASQHVGHHEHQHQSDQSTHRDDSGPDSKSSNFDADCGVCHVSCSMAVCDGIAPLNFAGVNAVFAPPPAFHLTLFSSKPTRPKWLVLA
jgi:hypothetical protein